MTERPIEPPMDPLDHPDELEDLAPGPDDDPLRAATDLGPEVPVEDAVEQRVPAAEPAETGDEVPADVPVEADPADHAEQVRVVEFDDDEYR